jgi:catechol 2,3-dioxygenase-like lactoylglutathione lyase family enzyme
MPATGLDHVTIVTKNLRASCDFYIGVLGLEEADFRPAFAFDGAWLKLGESAVVHLIAADRGPSDGTTRPFDHYALSATDMKAMRTTLEAHGIPYTEQTPPASAIRQIFIHDPDGVRVELNFDAVAEESAGTL